jgi:hypothetical protein
MFAQRELLMDVALRRINMVAGIAAACGVAWGVWGGGNVIGALVFGAELFLVTAILGMVALLFSALR